MCFQFCSLFYLWLCWPLLSYSTQIYSWTVYFFLKKLFIWNRDWVIILKFCSLPNAFIIVLTIFSIPDPDSRFTVLTLNPVTCIMYIISFGLNLTTAIENPDKTWYKSRNPLSNRHLALVDHVKLRYIWR